MEYGVSDLIITMLVTLVNAVAAVLVAWLNSKRRVQQKEDDRIRALPASNPEPRTNMDPESTSTSQCVNKNNK